MAGGESRTTDDIRRPIYQNRMKVGRIDGRSYHAGQNQRPSPRSGSLPPIRDLICPRQMLQEPFYPIRPCQETEVIEILGLSG